MAQPLTVLDQDIETGDLAADASGLRLAVGPAAVVVLVSNAIREQPGENRKLPTRGTAWADLLGKGASPVAVRTAIAKRAAATSGVTRIVSCEVDDAAPTLPCRLSLETTEGPVSLDVGVG